MITIQSFLQICKNKNVMNIACNRFVAFNSQQFGNSSKKGENIEKFKETHKNYTHQEISEYKKKLELQMKPIFHRETWIEVDLDNIEHNIKQIKKKQNKHTKMYAVIKGNAYGHGDVVVADRAIRAGAEALAVATTDEALRLRKFGFTVPVLLLGYCKAEDALLAAEHDFSVTVFHKEWLESARILPLRQKVKIHIKVDTGMGRIGIGNTEELKVLLKLISSNDAFELEGMFTHFANSEEVDPSFYQQQQEKFLPFLQTLRQNYHHRVLIHTGNSAASIRFPSEMQHFIRAGTSIYGLYPSQYVKEQQKIELKPALSLYTKLAHVKKMKAGTSVSYGRTYFTHGEEWIGSLPIGFGDGWRRKLQGQEVLVEGKRMPIVGKICMDQTMIKLDKHYPVGTKVTLIGKDGDDCISADEIAQKIEINNYEVTSMLGSRVPRTYKVAEEKLI